NVALAETIESLVAAGEAAGGGREQQIDAARRAFYSGFVAEAIEEFARTPAWDGAVAHPGFLTAADLDAWTAAEEEPAAVDVLGHRVLKTAAWGQGPVLLQQLQMLEALGAHELEPGSADQVHAVVEVSKLAFADREAWYGDEGDAALLAALLEPAYARERAALVGANADAALRPGTPGGREARLAAAAVRAMADGGTWADGLASAVQPGQGEPTVPRGDTCHLDVVDRWGNVVAATPSGAWLQSSPTIPALGFALGTRGQMFRLEEGLPASLVPGRRPRTTLSPGMVLRDDGRPALAFGTPGGDQQDQWTVPFLLRHLAHGQDLQAAIDAPSWHSTHAPSSFAPRVAELLGVHVEERLGTEVITELRRRGHDVTVTGPWSLGRISAAGIRTDGMLHAAANPRGMQGYATGR
uniref:gamma-glutamyltransferase n=1 Tax=Pseudactinotalea sp. TaxID=1926260 RepID=UPI003B3B9E71